MKKLVIKYLFLTLILVSGLANAQSVNFDTDLEGWNTNFGSLGTVSYEGSEGVDGALALTRTSDNANFGVKGTAASDLAIDATANKYIKIRFRNNTPGTQLRIGGLNGSSETIVNNSGGAIAFNIPTSMGGYIVRYLDVSSFTRWSGTPSNFYFQVRLNFGQPGEDKFYLDEVEFVSAPPGDTTAPVITLNGGDVTQNYLVGSYTDAGATANDNLDGDISAGIIVGGDTVDPNTPGVYKITYDVVDSESNAATQVTRTVVINFTPQILYTFDTDLSFWSNGTVSAGSGDVTYDATEGISNDGALVLDRASVNSNFGLEVAGIDADTYKFIRIRHKNGTDATQLRVQGFQDIDKNNPISQVSQTIEANRTEYTDTYFDMSSSTNWSGTVQDLDVLVRNNGANISTEGNFFVDEVEFLTSIPPSTFSEFIINPDFEDAAGDPHVGSRSFAVRDITTSEAQSGDKSLRITYTSDAIDTPDDPGTSGVNEAESGIFWSFSTYQETYASAFPVNTVVQVKMWVKTNRTDPIVVSSRVRTVNGGSNVSPFPITNVTTTNTAMEWEELTFDMTVTNGAFDALTFWFAINYDSAVPSNVTNLNSGDVVFVDNFSATITPPDTESPVIVSSNTATAIDEETGSGQLVYTATATDNIAVTNYSIGGTDASSFSINPSNGQVILIENPDYDVKSTYTFDVTASDASGNTDVETVTLTINNIIEEREVITFDSDLEGWTSFGNSPNIFATEINFDAGSGPNTGLAIVSPKEDDDTPNPGNTLTENTIMYPPTNLNLGGAGFNADAFKFVKVVLKNETAGTTLRIRCRPSGASSWANLDYIITANDTDFKTYNFELDETRWNGVNSDYAILVTDTSGSWTTDTKVSFDSIEFYNTSIDGFVQNPSFDDLIGSSTVWSPESKPYANVQVSDTEVNEGIQSLAHTYTATPTDTHFVENTYIHNFQETLNKTLRVSMWVKVVRSGLSSPLVTIQGQFRTGTTLVDGDLTSKSENITTTQTDGSWEKITFNVTPDASYSTGQFRYGIQMTNLQAGDIVYVDRIQSAIVDCTYDIVYDGSWSGGTGAGNAAGVNDDTKGVVIENSVTLSEDFECACLKINTGAVLTVPTDHFIKTDQLVLDGDLYLRGTSELVQTTTDTNLGSGSLYKIVGETRTSIYRYNFMTSPVNTSGTYSISNNVKFSIGPNLTDTRNISYINFVDGSESTLSRKWLNYLNNFSDFRPLSPTRNLISGLGYTIKGTGVVSEYSFIGTPNNGEINVPIGIDEILLTGNPYPSTINIDTFNSTMLASNITDGTVYLWEQPVGDEHAAGERDDIGGYATIVNGIKVAAINQSNDPVSGTTTPTEFIKPGQGFVVVGGSSGGNVQFTNALRDGIVYDGSRHFFKTKELKSLRAIVRVGFEYTKESGVISHRQLVTALEGGVMEREAGKDAYMFDYNNDDAYWRLPGETEYNRFIITSVPFESEDLELPIGVSIDTEKEITFKLDGTENLQGRAYLYDDTAKTLTDLHEDIYKVNLESGEYNDRFSLVFKTEETLSNATVVDETTSTKTVIKTEEGIISVVLEDDNIDTINLYSLTGEILLDATMETSSSSTIVNATSLTSGVYIIKIKTKKATITKKIVL
ncbi:immunoglobulin-like domain-containing protein [Wenyingzhuangia sp. IMCC45533]